MKPFKKYTVGKHDVFRGRTGKWYVYDTKDKRYIGGSFDTMKQAKTYANER